MPTSLSILAEQLNHQESVSRLQALLMFAAMAGIPAVNDDELAEQFAQRGLLAKIAASATAFSLEAPLAKGEFFQLIYNIESAGNAFNVSPEALARIVQNVFDTIQDLQKRGAFTDVDYNHPHDRAIYHAVANGYLKPDRKGAFDDEAPISGKEFCSVFKCLAANAEQPPELKIASQLRGILDGEHSSLAFTAAINVYKKTAAAIAGPKFDAELKKVLRPILNEFKTAGRPPKQLRKDVVGDDNDQDSWISVYPDGPFVREFHFDSLKPTTDAVEIIQINDTHLNLVNDKDEEEQNPSVMSTKLYRMWLKNGSSAPTIRNAMNFARFSDQTVIAGDILDYLSWGCKQLTVETIFRNDVNVLACLGGHDTTRVMQGLVPDPTSLESRRQWLADFWPNSIDYASRILKDKVMTVLLDNSGSCYRQGAAESLQADIGKCRENGYIMLIFQHEPICTRNPDETALMPIRANAHTNFDFCNYNVGREDVSTKDTLDVYNLIVSNADVIKAVFCGHKHSDYFTRIPATYVNSLGKKVHTFLPQHVLTGTVYDKIGHIGRIIVK